MAVDVHSMNNLQAAPDMDTAAFKLSAHGGPSLVRSAIFTGTVMANFQTGYKERATDARHMAPAPDA